MPFKKINYSKLIIIGIVWSVLYLDTMDRLYVHAFDFSPLTGSDWQERLSDFIHNNWTIKTRRDWGLFMGMILFLPLFFIGWALLYHIRWHKLFHRSPQIQTVETHPQPVLPHRKEFKPTGLRVQSSALLSVAPAQQTNTPPSGNIIPEGGEAIPQTEIPDIPQIQTPQKIYDDEAEVQQLLAETASIPADFFPHVSLEGAYASFALSTEKQAAVVRILNRPESTWAVDTEVPITESDWFYETGLVTAPAKDAIAIAQNLHDSEPDSTALPVILLMGGTLLNVEETLAYFEKNDVLLLRTENVDEPSIPLFMDFAKEYFGTNEDQS